MKIIHLSDLHFNSDAYAVWPHAIVEPLSRLVNSEKDQDNNIFLIISGDITTKGDESGFSKALTFLKEVINDRIDKKNIILCPGNHDISATNDFSCFNSFSYSLRGDDVFTFDILKTAAIHFVDTNCFLSLNSSQHMDKKYGLVDIGAIQKILLENKAKINDSDNKIAIVHHHFLGAYNDDISTIRNAYQMLNLLEEFGFNYIFHGHQHMRQAYSFNNIKIKGMSSMMATGALSNCVGIYTTGEGIDCFNDYFYLKDKIRGGVFGEFTKIEI